MREQEREFETRVTESNLHLLQSLLHYHERVTMKCWSRDCPEEPERERECLEANVTDLYARALREAIRCIRIVHGVTD